MTVAPRIYDAKVLTKIATFYEKMTKLIDEFEPDVISTAENPLYIFSMEIVIRHRDDYTVGRIGMDDFPFFEITDETYGEKKQT